MVGRGEKRPSISNVYCDDALFSSFSSYGAFDSELLNPTPRTLPAALAPDTSRAPTLLKTGLGLRLPTDGDVETLLGFRSAPDSAPIGCSDDCRGWEAILPPLGTLATGVTPPWTRCRVPGRFFSRDVRQFSYHRLLLSSRSSTRHSEKTLSRRRPKSQWAASYGSAKPQGKRRPTLSPFFSCGAYGGRS